MSFKVRVCFLATTRRTRRFPVEPNKKVKTKIVRVAILAASSTAVPRVLLKISDEIFIFRLEFYSKPLAL